MKKRVTAGIAVGLSSLLCGAFSVGMMAEEITAYQLGDTVNNFVMSTFANETVSLDELLEERDAVLITLWSSWSESSALQTDALIQISEELGDQVGIMAVTSKEWDTLSEAEEIWANMVEPSLLEYPAENLTGGKISEELAVKFACEAYPTTYLIDKNHTLCYVHEGLISDMDALCQQLEQVYTSDSYGESVLMEELPESEMFRVSEDEAQLSQVLTDGQMEITNIENDPEFDVTDVSPFLLNDDASAVYPSNQGTGNTLAALKIDFSADAGNLLAVDYRMDHTSADSGMLLLHVDGRLENTIRKDTEDWETAYITVKNAGDHELFIRYLAAFEDREDRLEVGNVRLLTDEEAAQVHDPLENAPKNLEEQEGRIELLDAEDAKKLQNTEFDDDTTEKWIAENTETVRLKIQVGEAFKLNNAVITIMQSAFQEISDAGFEDFGLEYTSSMITMENSGEQILFLKDLEWDEDGFYLDLPLLEGTNTVTLAESALTGNTTASAIIYTDTEAPMQEQMNMLYALNDSPEFLESLVDYFSEYCYEDGTPLYSDAETIRQILGVSGEMASEYETEEKSVFYTLHIRSELEKPVEGVITQWFDEDGMMQTAVTDENGDAVITGAAGDYTVHVLILPEKFAAVTENLMINENETEQTLTVYYR